MFPSCLQNGQQPKAKKGINPRDMHKGGITHRTSNGVAGGEEQWSYPGLLLPE